jgi:hypothetical protein
MPVNAIPSDPIIKVIISGLVVSAIKDKNDFAEIGAIVDSRCHKARLKVRKRAPGVPEKTIHRFDPDKSVSLIVEATSRTKVETFEGTASFDRLTGSGDERDFRWLVDIETDLHQGKEYTPKKDSLNPIFQVQKALFYTDERSVQKMMIKRGLSDPVLFGKTAEIIAANVYLDQFQSKAVLMADGEEILTITASDVVQGIRHTIEFDCTCPAIVPDVSDFNAVYAAIKPETPVDEQVTFVGEDDAATVLPVANPIVMCIGGNIARLTQLSS